MIVQLLGILDLLAAGFLILAKWDIGTEIGLVLAILLILKSLSFLTWWVSWVDLVAGIILLLAATGNYFFFSWLFSLWLIGKAFLSLAS